MSLFVLLHIDRGGVKTNTIAGAGGVVISVQTLVLCIGLCNLEITIHFGYFYWQMVECT